MDGGSLHRFWQPVDDSNDSATRDWRLTVDAATNHDNK
jgi:hypothetical protein